MHRYVALILAGFFIAAVYALSAPAEVTNYPSNGTDIVAIGDSLVVGFGASEKGGFVSQLARAVGEPIVNLGFSGDTTAQVLARIGELDAYDPKVVIVLAGGNDYLQRIPQEQTFQNLARIIEEVHARGASVLLLGVRGGVILDNFKEGFEALQKTHNTAYVSDVLEGLLGRREYMADQIHPNDLGYERIAARVLPELQRVLR